MRKSVVFIGLVAIIGLAGIASADSWAVNNAAAMGGTTWGFQITHTNAAPAAYVEDDTPASESIYRFTFLFNPGTITGATKNFRQAIMRGTGPNPRPGVGTCSANPAATPAVLQVWLYAVGGTGRTPTVQIYGKGNSCGDQSAKRVTLTPATAYRICGEWWTGASATGHVALAVVDPSAACPTHGGAGWQTSAGYSNNLVHLDMIRLGTPALNNFAAGEAVTMYFDEFASFRTLNP
jgi:hypothetical protein